MIRRRRTTIAIFGITGLIGGSLGMALVRGGRSRWRVVGWGRNRGRLRRARRLHACQHATTDLVEATKAADIVVLAVPVDSMSASLQRIQRYLKSDAVVTDVSSVKQKIHQDVRHVWGPADSRRFVGGHPLAGSEKTGVENGRADLFHGAACVLTRESNPSADAVEIVKRLWRSAGARPLLMRAKEHDELVALTSHLPHVLAATLVQCVSHIRKRNSHVAKLLAGSFWDITRVAACDPAQWDQILRANKNELRKAGRLYASTMQKSIRHSRWKAFFTEAGKSRARLLSR